MARRGIKLDTVCPVCKRLDEDCCHLFFKCKYAKQCWHLMNMEDLRIILQECRSGKDTINRIWTFDKNGQLKVMVLMWRWWSAGNKANQGRKMLTAAEIQSSVLYYLSEFEKLNTTNQIMPKIIKGS